MIIVREWISFYNFLINGFKIIQSALFKYFLKKTLRALRESEFIEPLYDIRKRSCCRFKPKCLF